MRGKPFICTHHLILQTLQAFHHQNSCQKHLQAQVQLRKSYENIPGVSVCVLLWLRVCKEGARSQGLPESRGTERSRLRIGVPDSPTSRRIRVAEKRSMPPVVANVSTLHQIAKETNHQLHRESCRATLIRQRAATNTADQCRSRGRPTGTVRHQTGNTVSECQTTVKKLAASAT